MTINHEQAEWFADAFHALVANVERAIVGKTRVVELAFTALIGEGNLLLEDYPGTGKTSLARAMAQTVKGTSNRIQFTPDLLPGDVTGITFYDQKTGEFVFHAGPVFANVVLADEINRASPKTQSALLEVMEEGKVTVDGVSRPVGSPFIVIATQNPIEQSGTHRLPEAQLDRFMMKTSLGYPDRAATAAILSKVGQPSSAAPLPAVITLHALLGLIDLARRVHVDPVIIDYIGRLVEATRTAAQVRVGSSVRGAVALIKAAKTWAIAQRRTYVVPDDVKDLAIAVLAHRLVLDPEAEFDGITGEAVVAQILLAVMPPVQKEGL